MMGQNTSREIDKDEDSDIEYDSNADPRVDIYRMMYLLTPKILSINEPKCWYCETEIYDDCENVIINIMTVHGDEPKDVVIPEEEEHCMYCNNKWVMQYTYSVIKRKFIETISSTGEAWRLFPGIGWDPHHVGIYKYHVDYIGSFD